MIIMPSAILMLLLAARAPDCSLQGPAVHSNTLPGVSPGARNQAGPSRLFSRVEEGLNAGNISELLPYFAAQVSISLRGWEEGYFSPGQACSLLEQFIRTRKLTGVRFSTVDTSAERPYATGSAFITAKGNRERVQVYISLTPAGDRWTIHLLNIH